MPRGKMLHTKLADAAVTGFKTFLSNAKADDFLKLSATVGLTVIVHGTLVASEDFVKKLSSLPASAFTPVWEYWEAAGGPIQYYFRPFWEPRKKPKVEGEGVPAEAMDMNLWLTSFVVAALIVLWGPSIIESLGGIVKVGLLLFA